MLFFDLLECKRLLALTCLVKPSSHFGNLFLQLELFLHAWTLFVPTGILTSLSGHIFGAYPGSARNALYVSMVELLAKAHVSTAGVETGDNC